MVQRLGLPTRRGLVTCVTAIGIALSAGACGTLDKAHSVAVVNGQAISVSDVATATQQYNEFVASKSGKAPNTEARTVTVLVLAGFIIDYVTATGKWKPDVAYNNLLSTVPDASPSTVELIKFDAITGGNTLTQPDVDAILAVMAKTKVEVDPRYGTFDASQGGLRPRDLNWMKTVPADQNPEPATPTQ
ncbi:hypothetical protein [Lapillicoccus sp.]|uniref:hypothetical protein n=1 Tax=Lapillicoccus sp. TaxID=1909287 RepID=UPI0025E14ACC|nr:hypothetical protein [Lapillicoccus sp.]